MTRTKLTQIVAWTALVLVVAAWLLILSVSSAFAQSISDTSVKMQSGKTLRQSVTDGDIGNVDALSDFTLVCAQDETISDAGGNGTWTCASLDTTVLTKFDGFADCSTGQGLRQKAGGGLECFNFASRVSIDFTQDTNAAVFWNAQTLSGAGIADVLGNLALSQNCDVTGCTGDPGLFTFPPATGAFLAAGWPSATKLIRNPAAANNYISNSSGPAADVLECQATNEFSVQFPTIIDTAATASHSMFDHLASNNGWQPFHDVSADFFRLTLGQADNTTRNFASASIGDTRNVYTVLGLRMGWGQCTDDTNEPCCISWDCPGNNGTCDTSGLNADVQACGAVEFFKDGTQHCAGGTCDRMTNDICTGAATPIACCSGVKQGNCGPDLLNAANVQAFGSISGTDYFGDFGPTLLLCDTLPDTSMCMWARYGPEGTNGDSTGFTCTLP